MLNLKYGNQAGTLTNRIDTVTYLTQETFGDEIRVIFDAITGPLWSRSNQTPLPATI